MWTSGASYEHYVGRWSRLVARQFLTWLDVPLGAKWLDVGCGTGAPSQTILEIASPNAVLGIDSSEGYIDNRFICLGHFDIIYGHSLTLYGIFIIVVLIW
jgi:trans-aconitate methyltransferase